MLKQFHLEQTAVIILNEELNVHGLKKKAKPHCKVDVRKGRAVFDKDKGGSESHAASWDELKPKGSSLACPTYAGRSGGFCWLSEREASQGAPDFHTAGPSDQADVRKGRDLW